MTFNKVPDRPNGTYYHFTEYNVRLMLEECITLCNGDTVPSDAEIEELLTKYRTARFVISEGHCG